MKRIGMFLLAAALIAAGTAGAAQRSAMKPNDASATGTALARETDAFFKDSQPGGVVLVTRGDAVLLRKAYGMAAIENGVPMQPETVLRLASVTKQFMAVAVLQLVQAGKLRLDATLVSLDPALNGPLARVTVQQLLAQTSVIKNISSVPASRATRRGPGRAANCRARFVAMSSPDRLTPFAPTAA